MPIKPRPRPTVPKNAVLSIEQKRQQHPLGTFERAVVELQELEALKEACREADNAANRQSTQAKKAFKDLPNLDPKDEIALGEKAYSFDVTHMEKVNPKELFKLYKAGKITEEMFVGSITVSKDTASKFIGAHVLLGITEMVDGKELDIRGRKLDLPVTKPTLLKHGKPEAKGKLSRSTESAPPAMLKPGQKPARLFIARRISV